MSLPLPPIDGVIAVAAPERLGAEAALQGVVAVAAGDRGRDRIGERAIRIVDASGVVAVAHPDADRVDVGPGEREVGGAVVAGVDLDPARVAGLQAKRNLLPAVAALDASVPCLRSARTPSAL